MSCFSVIHKSAHQEDCALEAHLNPFSPSPLTNEISIRERPWSSRPLPASPHHHPLPIPVSPSSQPKLNSGEV
ncbi:hypothetical protein JTE90_011556 [Oedothorax gibbosus]|uniref:Uncharacterized protein n=1 Tax=Oedothorax gibbosus TaxID=931172 RepID=A0AAV6UJX1_9ARAC|nr:hypothetical protein JTE90_011556 [Oedothorax gibbosus]